MYERTAGIIGLQVRKVPLRDDFSFDIPGFLNAVSDDSLLVIDSPNNPSGSALSIPEIERILREGKVYTVIDEAYFEFNGITSATLLKQYPNLIILRTFSKAVCLAGLRFGYLLCDPRLHGEIDKYRQPFSVSSLTQIAAESVLENIGSLSRIHTEISRQRERLFSGMLNLDGIRPYPSRANFILTEFTGSSSRDVFDQLLNEGILVRDFSHPRLENKLRITVGTKEENAFFLNVLSKILRRRK
jgi:histidinol-phosphate aminotransferase